ncbi:hypothetical protein RHIZ404_200001 [Rhizobium sp. EC-SD404]|nr:hypothetical protein RHIZ404_200001 [Rhizobium sp. EC-SD404]
MIWFIGCRRMDTLSMVGIMTLSDRVAPGVALCFRGRQGIRILITRHLHQVFAPCRRKTHR